MLFVTALLSVFAFFKKRYLFKLPRIIVNFIHGQLYTEFTINNDFWGDDRYAFDAFLEWFNTSPYVIWSRNFSISTKYDHEGNTIIGKTSGYGYHYFKYKNVFGYFCKDRQNSSGVGFQKSSLTIRLYTRNSNVLNELMAEIKLHKQAKEKTNVLEARHWYGIDGWGAASEEIVRPLNSVVLHADVKQRLIEAMDRFETRKMWNIERGFTHKLTMILYGPPGTGKTSLIKAIASEYKRNIYSINLNSVTDLSLHDAISRVPPKSVICFEDFEQVSALVARDLQHAPVYEDNTYKSLNSTNKKLKNLNEAIPADNESPTPSSRKSSQDSGFLTLSGLLNTFEGVIGLHDKVIILTSNNLDGIDKAFLRKGRIDEMFHIDHLTDKEIKEYISHFFKEALEYFDESTTFNKIPGSDLTALYKVHSDNPKGFIEALKQI